MTGTKINKVSSSIPTTTETFQSPSTETKKDQTHHIAITRLMKEERSPSEKALGALGLSVKILFTPITLLIYLIYKSCSYVASDHGLGDDEQTKSVDQDKRDELLAIGGEEIRFGFDKESVLEGMYFKGDPIVTLADSNPKTILLCTGSHASFEEYAVPMVKALKAMGHNVMVFNYAGFGNSEGSRSEKNVYESTEAAYQYLRQEKGVSDEDIVGWGYSLGSGAVSELKSKHNIKVVIDRGFSSMSEVAYHTAQSGQKTIARMIFMIGAHFDNVSKLKASEGNILIAQGAYDPMKEKHHGTLLQQATSNKKNVVYTKINCGHYHTDSVWFQFGQDRAIVEQFLDQ